MDIEKAKKVFEKYINGKDTMKETLVKAIKVLLNELEKYEKQLDLDYVENELDNKDKIINEMGEHIEKGCDFDSTIQTKEQIIDYFTKKVEGK